jgi:putative membrane protein
LYQNDEPNPPAGWSVVTTAEPTESVESADGDSWLGVYLRGLCMGTADAIPGVSGGTIAMIVGIYERLIAAITTIDPDRIFAVLRGITSAGRRDGWEALREMDALFLVVLGTGILTAIVTVTRVAHWAITAVPVPTYGLFFGLIGASALVLYAEVGLDTWAERGAAVAGFVLAFVVSGQADAALQSGPFVTFFAGALAVSAMILPGVSGSLLLVLIGQYEFMTGELGAFVDGLLALVTGGGLDSVVSAGTTVVAFVAGAVVGLFTVAHAVRKALATYREPTLAFLVSLIAGALRAPVVQSSVALAEAGRSWTPTALGTFAVAGLVGVGLVVVIDSFAGDIDY